MSRNVRLRRASPAGAAAKPNGKSHSGCAPNSEIRPVRKAREERATQILNYARRTIASLHSYFPSLDVEQIEDAVSGAIVDWCRFSVKAEPPDAAKFLHRAAWRNARDLVCSESARREREHAWREQFASELNPEAIDSDALATTIQRILDLLPDDRMRATFRLRAAGERRTTAYAQALGSALADTEAQRGLVKREKDRLDKYLRRDPTVRMLAASIRGDTGVTPGSARDDVELS